MKRISRRTGQEMRLALERLEPRDLPSLGSGALFPGLHVPSLVAARSSMSSSGGLPGDSSQGQPLPHEQARQKFTAVFYGPYVVGPPRFSMQSSQTYSQGGGISNIFRHGNAQVAFYEPADPTQSPTGEAVLYDKSFLMTSNILFLKLQANPQPGASGRITQWTWTPDNSSSGAFTNASGQGSLQIIYHRGQRTAPRATDQGNASLIFRGNLYLLGVGNPLRIGSA